MTSGGEINAGLVEKSLIAMKEAVALGLSPEELSATADEIKRRGVKQDRRLAEKLSDLSRIMSLYKTLLKENFQDSDDQLSMLEKKLREGGEELLSGVKIYIQGFTSFTEPQYRVLAALMRHTDVTVALCLPKAAADRFEYTEIRDAHERLVRLANKEGVDVSQKRLDGRNTPCPTLITEICDSIWRTNGKIDKSCLQNDGALRIFAAETPYDECDFIAQDIKRRVMAGERYSDFAIVARSIDAYGGIMNTAFDKAGIPLFLTVRQDISSYEVIKLIYSAFSAVSGGYQRADVIAYSKCSISGIPRSLSDEFELYCEMWQINGRRFTDGEFWNMNPNGYDSRPENIDEKLSRIDLARHSITDPLINLEAGLSGDTVLSHAKALFAFMQELRLEEKLIERAEKQRRAGDKDAALDTERLYRTICDVLDAICKILPDTKISPSTFLNLLKIAFSEADIGRIPSFVDKVTAGSADTMRVYGKKHIYILGLSFGSFPRSVSDDAYFTDKDRSRLSGYNLNLPLESNTRSARELYYLIRALSFAERSVTLLYPERDSSFKPTLPSDAINRIVALTEGAVEPVRISSLSPIDRTFSPEYALEHSFTDGEASAAISKALCDTGYADRLHLSSQSIKNSSLKLSTDIAERFYGERIPLSQSKIDKFVGCPMSYFCSYNLKLSPEKRAEFDAGSIGTFVHSVLENFFKYIRENNSDIKSLTEEERDRILLGVAKRFIDDSFEGVARRSARIDAQIDRLRRAARPVVDSLCREFSNSEFQPVFFELGINRKDQDAPEPAVFKTSDGREIFINGIVDRVDTYKSGEDVYVRIVDYKTGQKTFSKDDIAEGKNLQMFLYLKSIIETEKSGFRDRIGAGEGGRLIPAGVIYMKADIKDGKIPRSDPEAAKAAVEEMQLRIGLVLDEEESLAAMNPSYLPVKYDDKGKPTRYTVQNLYTLPEWDSFCDTISNVMRDIGDRMVSGDISATPFKNGKKNSSCTYCDFKAICRNAKV